MGLRGQVLIFVVLAKDSVIPVKTGTADPLLWACRGRFTPLGARASRPQSRAGARRTLILAFSHKGLTGVGLP